MFRVWFLRGNHCYKHWILLKSSLAFQSAVTVVLWFGAAHVRLTLLASTVARTCWTTWAAGAGTDALQTHIKRDRVIQTTQGRTSNQTAQGLKNVSVFRKTFYRQFCKKRKPLFASASFIRDQKTAQNNFIRPFSPKACTFRKNT